MDEKSQKRLDKYSREELYELVWSEAMFTLSPKLGLSDVGLKKRCKRLGIPTPPRGYWAKLEAGKPVQKTPLPKKLPEKQAPKPIPLSKEEIGKFQLPRKDYSIARRLPLIAAAQRALEIAPFNAEGLREVRGDGILQTKLSDESLGRGMWLWTELILRLKATGLKISVADGTFVVKKRKRVTIELKEMVAVYKSDSQQGRVPTLAVVAGHRQEFSSFVRIDMTSAPSPHNGKTAERVRWTSGSMRLYRPFGILLVRSRTKNFPYQVVQDALRPSAPHSKKQDS